MIVALDVGYTEILGATTGTCGLVAFEQWTDLDPVAVLSVSTPNVAPYVPGRFFERELPCLIAGLDHYTAAVGQAPLVVVIDGHVRLDNRGTRGLGLHLFRELGESIPIIGVAKNPFRGLNAVEVFRGESTIPLHVTAVGLDEDEAASCVASMAGEFRVPTLLRRADQLSRLRA